MWCLYVWSLYVYTCVIFVCTHYTYVWSLYVIFICVIFICIHMCDLYMYIYICKYVRTSCASVYEVQYMIQYIIICMMQYIIIILNMIMMYRIILQWFKTYIYIRRKHRIRAICNATHDAYVLFLPYTYVYFCVLIIYIHMYTYIHHDEQTICAYSPFFRFRSLSLSLLCTRTHSLSLSRSLSCGFSLSHTHTLSRTLSLTHSLPFLWGVLNLTYRICCVLSVVWLWLVGLIKLYVSFAKEPYKRDNILQKRQII